MTTLQISDGTTTVDLVYHSSTNPYYMFERDQWRPSVAPLRTATLGGYGPYEEVEEDIGVLVSASTASSVLSRIQTLARLLTQAGRWTRGEPVSPVVVRFAPHDSGVANYRSALITGPIGGGVELGSTFNSEVAQQSVSIRLRFRRRGPWIGATDTSGPSVPAANCTVIARSAGPSVLTSSPIDVYIAGFDAVNTPTITAGYLMVGSSANDIQVLEAEAGAAGAFTNVADAAALASGGAVLRYTPVATTPTTTAAIGVVTIAGNIAIYAAVRNNSGTTTWTLRANVIDNISGAAMSTPEIAIDASTLNPRIVFLGVVNTLATWITLTATASAVAGTLDIDYLIVVNLRDETVSVVAHDAVTLPVAGGLGSIAAQFHPLSARTPILNMVCAGNTLMTYRGVLPLHLIGQNVYALWTAPNGAYWRFTDIANAIVNVSLNVTRYRSYLTPE